MGGAGSESDCTDNEELNESSLSSNKRAPSLSEHERSILYGLVAKYKLIVESKHNTAQWIAKKQATWNMINNEFLSKPGTSNRTSKQLKKCYENYKRLIRKKEILKKETSTMPLKLKDIGVPKEHTKRMSVRNIDKKTARRTHPESNQSENENNNSSTGSDANCSPMESELHAQKVKLVNLQIEYEEMKIRFLQEEHDLRMTLLQKQCNAKSTESLLLNDVDIKSIIL